MLGSLLVSACSEEVPQPPPDERTEPPPRVVAEAQGELPPAPSAAWPDDITDLASSVESFESVEACLAELRARTPTPVAEGLADLAYDGFFDDVCHGMLALKERSAERCDALEVSSVRAGCRRRLALLAGRPELCPRDRVLRGREPTCVAWAARDPGLCRAASELDRVTCHAVLLRSEERCSSADGGDRERCRALVRRYAGALGEEETGTARGEQSVFQFTIREEGAEPLEVERSVLARGVRLEARGCRYRVELADELDGLPPFGQRPEASVALELTFAQGDLPIEIPLGGTDAVLRVRHPSRGALSSILTGAPSAGASTVTLERFEPRFGGALAGRARATLSDAGASIVVEGRFVTFVRDLEPLEGACGR